MCPRVWKRLLGVDAKTVIEHIEYDEDTDAVIAHVRVRKPTRRRRCGKCRQPAPGYDDGDGRRRWRALDLGTIKVWLEAEAPRVKCAEHGVTVAWVPWARHDARFTTPFEEQVAWLATHTSQSAVKQLMRIAWASVGRIITRVVAERGALIDPLADLRRIGIDEISYRKGHNYLIVVVDHVTGRLVWAAPGRDRKTLRQFFDLLGQDRCKQVQLVSADAAEWIAGVVAERCKNATLCLDPFHIVAWATDALDEVRREVWNDARRAGQKALAKDLKGARYALWKNPQDLTERQQAKLSDIRRTNDRLYRAYLMKEQLRMVFHQDTLPQALDLLAAWLAWACRSRIPAFVELSRKIRRHRDGIHAALVNGLSNARVESVNTKIRLITRRAFGLRSPEALIALAMLCLGGLCPPLPGRNAPSTQAAAA